ncbi:MAG: C40 family peptidase [Micrococcus sp.]|nr:C40 family peptidase [Micrococcus sp.]
MNTITAPTLGRRGVFGAGALVLTGALFGTAAPSAEAAVSVRNRAGIVRTASRGIGVRYRYGGTTTKGWDCSGFTRWVYAKHGVRLGRTVSAQKRMGRRVAKSQRRKGDLVIWGTYHVGIYAGNNQVIDAGNSRVNTSRRRIWGSPSYYRIGR